MKTILNLARSASLGIPLALCFGTMSYAQQAAGTDNTAAVSADAPHIPPTNWNDTFVGARYASDFYFPGSDKSVAQKIGTVNTSGGFKYGTYVVNVDYLESDGNNPVNNGTSGATEIYSVGHIEWSANKIFHTNLGNSFIRDYGFITGYELSDKNDAYASRARMWTLGPSIDFAVPRGFWNFMIGARHETNHNGIVYSDVDYQTAWHVESAWNLPFNVGPVPMVFKGFAAITGPKGKDGFHVQTVTETLVRTSLMFDVGSYFGAPKTFYVGPGYEYWNNMFGTPSSEAKGTHRSAPTINAELHF